MSTEGEKFETLKKFLWYLPCNFCFVYQASEICSVKEGKERKSIVELKWCRSFSLIKKTSKENEKLATKYQEVAVNCYEHNRNLILKENKSHPDSKTILWCGLAIPADAKNPLPANSLGQRWWYLIVGSGATRKAGYVIVARVAAKEANELHDHITKIQKIMGGEVAIN